MACKYCSWTDKPVPIFFHGVEFPVACVYGDHLAVDVWEKERIFSEPKRRRLTSPINFCPMCGRDLRGDDQ